MRAAREDARHAHGRTQDTRTGGRKTHAREDARHTPSGGQPFAERLQRLIWFSEFPSEHWFKSAIADVMFRAKHHPPFGKTSPTSVETLPQKPTIKASQIYPLSTIHFPLSTTLT
jgi:hypothetical protein